MARLTVDEKLFKDIRFIELCSKLGPDLAIGSLIRAWAAAQPFWKTSDNGIPKPEWHKQRLPMAIVEVGLAEERGDFFYIKGSAFYFRWIRDAIEAGRAGGKKRARNHSENLQANSSESKRNQPSPSPSPSFSPSSSSSKKTNTERKAPSRPSRVCEFDLESVYKIYPVKKGKSNGMDRLAREIKTAEDFEALKIAVSRYMQTEEVKRGFVKHWSTFANEWRDWTDPDAGSVSVQQEPVGTDWEFLRAKFGGQAK